MKKLLFVSLASAFVLAMFVPQTMAGEKVKAEEKVKVDVCHIIAANDVIQFGPVELYFGKMNSISENAVDAHLGHGDFTSFWGGDVAAGPINAFREAGAHLPAANCYFGVNADGPFGPPE